MTATRHQWFDDSTAPVFYFAFPLHMSNTSLEDYCRWFAAWYARQSAPVAMICDLSHASLITPRQRQIWSHFERGSEADFKRVLCAVGIVAPGSMQRGVVTAAYWMHRPVYAWKVFDSSDEARPWLREQLTPPR